MRSVLALAAGLLISGCGTDGRETSTDKHEWSILQGIELNTRTTQIADTEFRSIDGYELLALPSLTGGQHVWILLHAKASPFYKQMPNLNYTIKKELVDKLASEGRISPTVEQVLRSRIQQ
jgi:hypothetical protein